MYSRVTDQEQLTREASMRRQTRAFVAHVSAVLADHPDQRPRGVAIDLPGPATEEARNKLRAHERAAHEKLRAHERAAHEVVDAVACGHGVSLADIMGRSRTVRVYRARKEAYRELRRELGWSARQIGRYLGGRDHTTVLHGLGGHIRRRGRT